MVIPAAQSYGGVLIDRRRRVLLREPRGHFGGYAWTFAKGRPDAGETPEQTALREVLEETGYRATIVAAIPKVFPGTTVTTAYFVMAPVGEPAPFDPETASIRWTTPDEARSLIALTKPAQGRARDLEVLRFALLLAEAGPDQ